MINRAHHSLPHRTTHRLPKLAAIVALSTGMTATLALADDEVGRFVEGSDGTRLFAREWGNPDGPAILFIHGWSQSSASWQAQTEGSLADEFRIVAYDWRGHGASDAIHDPAVHQDGGLIADDVAAVIDAFGLEAPVLVGWSYGGIIIGDYLAKYGAQEIAGVVMTGAVPGIGVEEFAPHFGSGVEHAATASSSDFATQYEGIEAFLTLCFAEPPEDAVLDEAMAINMQTSPQVRGYYLSRVVDHRPTYAALEKPLLVTHGANDHVVLASMADLFAQAQPNATVSIYEASGHLPFAEEADRFNTELAEFVRAANGE